jgi:hypothetical protein
MKRYLGIGTAFFLASVLVGCSSSPQSASPDAGLGAGVYNGQPLLPPPAHGYQINVGPFDIPPGGEKILCQYFQVPDQNAFAVTKYEVRMTAGSHHFLVVDTPYTTIPQQGLYDCSAEGELFSTATGLAFATQDEYDGITFPPGMGVYMKAGKVILVQTHYFNLDPNGATHQGYVTLNAETADPSTINQWAGYLFFDNQNLSIPPHSQTTVTKDCYANAPYRVLGLAGHFHQHGILFDVEQIPLGSSTGTSIYRTSMWDHPVPRYFTPPARPLPVGAGDDIQYSCAYENDTDQTLVFGNSAISNEMCILFGYYYPSDWSSPLLCY